MKTTEKITLPEISAEQLETVTGGHKWHGYTPAPKPQPKHPGKNRPRPGQRPG